jgi:hypothetical protein
VRRPVDGHVTPRRAAQLIRHLLFLAELRIDASRARSGLPIRRLPILQQETSTRAFPLAVAHPTV